MTTPEDHASMERAQEQARREQAEERRQRAEKTGGNSNGGQISGW